MDEKEVAEKIKSKCVELVDLIKELPNEGKLRYELNKMRELAESYAGLNDQSHSGHQY